MSRTHIPCVVAFSGTDPSGGAGAQADLKAISATGSYAANIITALVAQNTQTVHAIESVSTLFIRAQMDAVFEDLTVNAIKIGMLHTREVMDVIATGLERYLCKHVVLDPVMVAKNGAPLLAPDLIGYLKSRVFPCVNLITPNIPEAEALLAESITDSKSMLEAAKKLSQEYGVNVLLKGGHRVESKASDVFCSLDGQITHWFHAERIHTRNTHGTGCTLSAAIASYLAQGFSMLHAIDLAKEYLTKALQSAAHQRIGHGFGPVDHFYFLSSNQEEMCE